MKKGILLISNGYGEDTIAYFIAKAIQVINPEIEIKAFPLVGEGKFLKEFLLPGPIKAMPSGGDLHQKGVLLKDFKAGLLRLLYDQIIFLKSQRENFSLIVAVGDIMPFLLGYFIFKKPLVFVGTAKSTRVSGYWWWERKLIPALAIIGFVRDKETADTFKSDNIKWVGNPIVDAFEVKPEIVEEFTQLPLIGILPGSRLFAYRQLPVILKEIDLVMDYYKDKISFAVAWSSALEFPVWESFKIVNKEDLLGYIFTTKHRKIPVYKNKFGEIITSSILVIGQAGTGNEQAASLGKPVIAIKPAGEKRLDWYRRRQKQLLGEALCVVEEGELAKNIIELMENKQLYERKSKAGIERMGKQGGIKRIASAISNLWEEITMVKGK